MLLIFTLFFLSKTYRINVNNQLYLYNKLILKILTLNFFKHIFPYFLYKKKFGEITQVKDINSFHLRLNSQNLDGVKSCTTRMPNFTGVTCEIAHLQLLKSWSRGLIMVPPGAKARNI